VVRGQKVVRPSGLNSFIAGKDITKYQMSSKKHGLLDIKFSYPITFNIETIDKYMFLHVQKT